jgi:hypothetical protein
LTERAVHLGHIGETARNNNETQTRLSFFLRKLLELVVKLKP